MLSIFTAVAVRKMAAAMAAKGTFYAVDVAKPHGKIGDVCAFFGEFAMRRQRLKPLSEGNRALKRPENLAKLAILVKGTVAAIFAKKVFSL